MPAMKRFPLPHVIRVLVLIATLAGLTGCGLYFSPRKTERSSSTVNFLYPDQSEPLITPSIPVLRLPLRVGLAFVPSANIGEADFSEAQKSELLKKVAAEFKAYPFVESIQVLPTSYLRRGGGFQNLDQVRGLMGIDVIALLAYDQVQFTDENKLSLAYWTIVGAYFFHGNKNDTHTLMEAVVYDIPSRTLLFRAPGADLTHANTSLIGLRDKLREDSAKSFGLAATDLTKNLKTELESFRERVKNAPAGSEVARIEHKPGYTGGGAMDAWFAGVLGLLFTIRLWQNRRR